MGRRVVKMDANLAPFMQPAERLPSSFPKQSCSYTALVLSLVIICLALKRRASDRRDRSPRLTDYKLGQAGLMLALMVAYALCLRPLGFLGSTTVFLVADRSSVNADGM